MYRYQTSFPSFSQTILTKPSIYHGTALDTSLLIDHLGSYIFHGPENPSITQHLVMGISLGGHAAWQVLFNEPRVTAGIIIIGCPDYTSEYCRSFVAVCSATVYCVTKHLYHAVKSSEILWFGIRKTHVFSSIDSPEFE